MDRPIAIGLVSFAVTASLLAIPAVVSHQEEQSGSGILTRAQMKDRLAQRFAAADTNSDGAVDRDEAAAYRAQRQAERQARRFTHMGADDDGEISTAERDAMRVARSERRGAHRGAMMAVGGSPLQALKNGVVPIGVQ